MAESAFLSPSKSPEFIVLRRARISRRPTSGWKRRAWRSLDGFMGESPSSGCPGGGSWTSYQPFPRDFQDRTFRPERLGLIETTAHLPPSHRGTSRPPREVGAIRMLYGSATWD